MCEVCLASVVPGKGERCTPQMILVVVVVGRVVFFLFSSEGSFHIASLIGASAGRRNLSPGQVAYFLFSVGSAVPEGRAL